MIFCICFHAVRTIKRFSKGGHAMPTRISELTQEEIEARLGAIDFQIGKKMGLVCPIMMGKAYYEQEFPKNSYERGVKVGLRNGPRVFNLITTAGVVKQRI